MRHKVTRQFRHLCAIYRVAVPAGSIIVLRAQPSAATRSFAQLASDFRSALARLGYPAEGNVASRAEVDLRSNTGSTSTSTSRATAK